MTTWSTETPHGLYCPPGDFYIDPWRPVDRAVLTHAHADHARPGHTHYLAAALSEGVLRARLGQDITLQPLPYGEVVEHNGVRISLHPAGHVLGSAQVRLEHAGRVWVVSGDYKLEPRRPDLRAVRAAALPLLHHRVDLRPAHLSLATRCRSLRRHQRLVARQRRGRPCVAADGIQLRQGAAHARGRRRDHRADRRARRGADAQRGLSRRRRRAAADAPGHRGERPQRAEARAGGRPAQRGRQPVDAPLSRPQRCLRQRLDAVARRASPRAASTAASC